MSTENTLTKNTLPWPWKHRAYFTSYVNARTFLTAVRRKTLGNCRLRNPRPGYYIVMW